METDTDTSVHKENAVFAPRVQTNVNSRITSRAIFFVLSILLPGSSEKEHRSFFLNEKLAYFCPLLAGT